MNRFVEKMIVERLVRTAMRWHRVTVSYDGEIPVRLSYQPGKVIDAVFAVDECTLHFSRGLPDEPLRSPWVRLIMGNGIDIISDFSTSLEKEPFLVETLEFVEQIEKGDYQYEYSEEVQEIAKQIGMFFYGKYADETSDFIKRLKINDIRVTADGEVRIYLQRPGLFIGLRGEQIQELQERLDRKIAIYESQMSTLEDCLNYCWYETAFGMK